MGMYNQFETDKNHEKDGVWLDYGDFRVRVARAGGSNKRYITRLEAITKPYRRAMANETLARDVGESLLKEVYADTVVIAWETKDKHGEFVSGIEQRDGDGKLAEFNRDNVLAVFNDLPDLFAEISEQATKVALFRRDLLDEDVKNS